MFIFGDSSLCRTRQPAWSPGLIATTTCITPVLVGLHWLPVRQRIIYKTAVLVWKCLHDASPRYLADLCVPFTNIQTYLLTYFIVPDLIHVTIMSRNISWLHHRFSDVAYLLSCLGLTIPTITGFYWFFILHFGIKKFNPLPFHCPQCDFTQNIMGLSVGQ